MELIKIETNEQGQKLVSARDLHELLIVEEGKQERFSQWFKRHLQYGFEENVDYVGCKKIYTANQHGAIGELDDYAMTIDMAKELAMLQKSEKGRIVRQYFIECENKYQQIRLPQSPMEVMELMFNALKDTNQEIEDVKSDLQDHKNNSPLYNIECDELQNAVKKKAVELLGGKNSNAYKDKSIRQQVFGDLQKQIRREFRVDSYKAIKRCQLDKAKEIVAHYKLPYMLEQDVCWINNQMRLM